LPKTSEGYCKLADEKAALFGGKTQRVNLSEVEERIAGVMGRKADRGVDSEATSGLDRRGILIGGCLAAVAGISYLGAPKATASVVKKEEFRADIPNQIGGWRSRKTAELVLPSLDESDKLYENLETRIYEGAGLPSMMALIAYSSVQQNDIQVHRPEVCYPAAGYPIVSSRTTELRFDGKTIDAREVIADRGGVYERVIYWVRVGDEFPATWIDQRIAMARANLQGKVPDGVLVRMSTIEEPGKSASFDLRAFIEAFLRACAPSFRGSILI
jgi:EpsI family protein